MATIERIVHFHKIKTLNKKEKVPTKAEFKTVFQNINPKNKKSMVEVSKTEHMCIWNDTKPNEHEYIKFALGKIRHTAIPSTVVLGDRARLSANNILELVHCVLFDDNVIGSEVNGLGPQIWKHLPQYLTALLKDQLPALCLRQIMDKDILDTVGRFSELSMLHIQIKTENIGMIPKNGAKLSSAFNGISTGYGQAELDLIIRLPEVETAETNKDARFEQIQRENTIKKAFSTQIYTDLINLVPNGNVEQFEKLLIRGVDNRTGRVSEQNLIERLVRVKKRFELVDAQHRSVDASSAYAKIIEAHTELAATIKAGFTG